MEANGDITDAFDDEDLKRSIEAGEQGPWNDEQARFRDPKLEELERQLKKREIKGYRERRLAELQAQGMRERRQKAEAERRSAARQQRPKPEPHSRPRQRAPWNPDDSPPAPPPAADRPNEMTANEGRSEPAARPPTRSAQGAAPVPAAQPVPAPADTGESEPIQGAVESSVLVAYAPSVFASTLVFVAATLVHGSLEGWRTDLIYRAVIAMLVTGILWRRFQSGRLRATTIAVTVYLTGFITSNRLDHPESQVALFLGLLVVVAGSGLIGVQRDEFGEQTL